MVFFLCFAEDAEVHGAVSCRALFVPRYNNFIILSPSFFFIRELDFLEAECRLSVSQLLVWQHLTLMSQC